MFRLKKCFFRRFGAKNYNFMCFNYAVESRRHLFATFLLQVLGLKKYENHNIISCKERLQRSNEGQLNVKNSNILFTTTNVLSNQYYAIWGQFCLHTVNVLQGILCHGNITFLYNLFSQFYPMYTIFIKRFVSGYSTEYTLIDEKKNRS